MKTGMFVVVSMLCVAVTLLGAAQLIGGVELCKQQRQIDEISTAFTQLVLSGEKPIETDGFWGGDEYDVLFINFPKQTAYFNHKHGDETYKEIHRNVQLWLLEDWSKKRHLLGGD